MNTNFSYHQDINTLELISNRVAGAKYFNVRSTNTCTPSIKAYAGARYSRSSDTIINILRETNDTKAGQRLTNIITGYGHQSVGDMADIFICLENVPMLIALKLFNEIPDLAGQERSSRYQPTFFSSSIDYCDNLLSPFTNDKDKEEYDGIMQLWAMCIQQEYILAKQKLESIFKPSNKKEHQALESRLFDCLRYKLPIGTNTSLAITTSSRNWAHLISKWGGSKSELERNVALDLKELLTYEEEGVFLPEAYSLLKHTEPTDVYSSVETELWNTYYQELNKENVGFNKNFVSEEYKYSISTTDNYGLLDRILSYMYPNHSVNWESTLPSFKVRKASDVNGGPHYQVDNTFHFIQYLCTKYDRFNPPPNLYQTGDINFRLITDIGTIRDLNRHRSTERYIPLLEYDYNIGVAQKDMYFEDNPYYRLERRGDYSIFKERFQKFYTSLIERGEVTPEVNYVLKFLLPLGYSTEFYWSMSFADWRYIYDTRIRPGGHIAYRKLTYQLDKLLGGINNNLNPLYNKGINELCREQFFDRS